MLLDGCSQLFQLFLGKLPSRLERVWSDLFQGERDDLFTPCRRLSCDQRFWAFDFGFGPEDVPKTHPEFHPISCSKDDAWFRERPPPFLFKRRDATLIDGQNHLPQGNQSMPDPMRLAGKQNRIRLREYGSGSTRISMELCRLLQIRGFFAGRPGRRG